jgi:ubiquinone/menaquinone biosynthesis C-methylase UbiE
MASPGGGFSSLENRFDRVEGAPPELMSLYSKYALPRIIDLAMSNPETRRPRAVWIPQAHGQVLQVGIGSGLNLEFYSTEVERIYGVDPSIGFRRMARKRLGSIEVEFLSQSAEEPLPLADASIDTVVLTWTLCSIAEPQKALQEMKRVLKASGTLIFVEHGRSPDPGVAVWQDRLTPIWKRIGGGCHLNRKIDEIIKDSGFQISELTTSYIPGPRPMTYTYKGVAKTNHQAPT